jgi:hypothetical protein
MGALQQQRQQQGGGLQPTGEVGPPTITPPGGGQPTPQAAPAGAPPPGIQAQPPNIARAGTQSLPQAKQPGPAGYQNLNIRDMSEEPTEREQKEYTKAERALATVLYSNEEVSNSILGQIDPNDKIGSVAKASVLLMKTLDEKLDMDDSIIQQMTMETVDRVIELTEKRHGLNFEENEVQATLGAAWEGVMYSFGVDPSDVQDLSQRFNDDELGQLQNAQTQFLAGGQ